MSPRPTNSAGKTSRSPKTSVRGSTYFPLATLPRSTTCQPAAPSRAAGKGARVPHERPPVPRVSGIDIDPTVAAQKRRAHLDLGRPQPLAGCDHQCPVHTRWRAREGPRVGELAPEVEAAHEAEHLPQGGPLPALQAARKVEASLLAEDQLRPLTPAMRRREKEDARLPCPRQCRGPAPRARGAAARIARARRRARRWSRLRLPVARGPGYRAEPPAAGLPPRRGGGRRRAAA